MYDIILYHEKCPVGIGSAWVYYYYLQQTLDVTSDKIPYLPACAGKVPAEYDFADKNILLLDLSFRKEDLIHISSKAKFITIIEHHKSAAKDLEDFFASNVKIVFDMNKCAAELAWDYFFPDSIGQYPHFINIIADRDLWRWTHPNSKSIGAYLYTYGYYKSVDKLNELLKWTLELEYTTAAEKGEVILFIENQKIENTLNSAILCDFHTKNKVYRVYLIQCEHTIASEIGDRLSSRNDCDFAVMWRYSFHKNEWWLSLRSSKNRTDINLSEITKEFGGGGHAQASGMRIGGGNNLHNYFKVIK